MTAIAEYATLAHPPVPREPLTVAAPTFRFTDRNPLVPGYRSYARSRWDELPYLIGVLVRIGLGIKDQEWNGLVDTDAALNCVGPWHYTVPFTLAISAGGEQRMPYDVYNVAGTPAPRGKPPDDVCEDCHGTGVDIDSDASVTGTRDALFVCFCAGMWA